ncbi:MAG TPA: thiamine phosphate synthase [Burkholderiales bacterium]|nr:thiamine phosphate synthase [Burkholderiales bacterium]
MYAVTPDELDTVKLVRKVRMALAGGARTVQYRNKSADAALRREQAAALLAVCRAARVPLIINDDLDLAAALEADGLHLGRDDLPVAAARKRLSKGTLVGASCYDRLDLAVSARSAGADYVAFGSAFSSTTKPGATRAPLSLYRDAKARLDCPVVAIGGITSENARAVIEAGADAIAVISALFDARDIERSAREFASLFGVHGLEKRTPL